MADQKYHPGDRIGNLILLRLRHGYWSAWCACGSYVPSVRCLKQRVSCGCLKHIKKGKAKC